MKEEKISIYTNKKINFTVAVPETEDEYHAGLSYLKEIPDKYGMLYYKIRVSEARMWTPDTPWSVDFIFIDWCGNIRKIVTAEPFSKEVHTCKNIAAVLEIKGDECKRLDIQKGDTVFYSQTQITPKNEYMFGNFLYKKINRRNFTDIKPDELCFVAIAEGGAMGWRASMQFTAFSKNRIKRYMIDFRAVDFSGEELIKVFPHYKYFGIPELLNNKQWHWMYLGFGNHLFIKDEFFKEFDKKTKNSPEHIKYGAWEKIAEEILLKHGKIKKGNVQ